jgi:hypothetical protein
LRIFCFSAYFFNIGATVALVSISLPLATVIPLAIKLLVCKYTYHSGREPARTIVSHVSKATSQVGSMIFISSPVKETSHESIGILPIEELNHHILRN